MEHVDFGGLLRWLRLSLTADTTLVAARKGVEQDGEEIESRLRCLDY